MELRDVQLANKPNIVLTFFVLKLDTSMEVNLAQPIKTLCITSTLSVLNPERFTEVNEEQRANRYSIFLIFFVFQVERSIDSKDEQP